jgi:hypothetical protein
MTTSNDHYPPPPVTVSSVIPHNEDTLLIGVAGLSEIRTYWLDTPKGRDSAGIWLAVDPHLRHLFRVHFASVTELELTPPVPRVLREKGTP